MLKKSRICLYCLRMRLIVLFGVIATMEHTLLEALIIVSWKKFLTHAISRLLEVGFTFGSSKFLQGSSILFGDSKDAVCQPANVCRRKVFNVPLNASFVPMKLKTLGTFLSLAIKHKKSGNMLDFWSRELPWSSV